jgi:hypothetical protein
MRVALALGTALLTSFNPILYKRILRDAEPLVIVWGVTLLALPLLVLFTLMLLQLSQIDGVFIFAVRANSDKLNRLLTLTSRQTLDCGHPTFTNERHLTHDHSICRNSNQRFKGPCLGDSLGLGRSRTLSPIRFQVLLQFAVEIRRGG